MLKDHGNNDETEITDSRNLDNLLSTLKERPVSYELNWQRLFYPREEVDCRVILLIHCSNSEWFTPKFNYILCVKGNIS